MTPNESTYLQILDSLEDLVKRYPTLKNSEELETMLYAILSRLIHLNANIFERS